MSNELDMLDQQINELQAKRQAILESQRKVALEETLLNIRTYGFTAAELGLNVGEKGKKASDTRKAAKYANPADPSQTWAGGKGPRPKWVREHLNAGKALDDLLLPQ